MVKVPIWEPSVNDLPGASQTPHATPDAFGYQIGVAQEKAGRAIGSGLNTLGDAMTSVWNEQEALKGKSLLSDHEAAVTVFRTQLERDTPPDQVSTIPAKVTEFANKDWNDRRGGVSGRYQQQADATAHDYHNRVSTQVTTQTIANRDKYTELQLDSTVEKQNNAVMANPGQLDGAIGVVNSSVEETSLNPYEQRRLKLKYGAQLYDSVNKGYVERMKNEPLNTALEKEAEDFRKNGAAAISKGLNIQDLPATTPTPSGGGAVNRTRVNQINSKPAVASVIEKVSTANGVNPDEMKVQASIESSGNANAVTGSYKGLFQLSNKEFNKYVPGGNIFDPEQNTYAAVRKRIDEDAEFAKSHGGRKPTLTETYMQHQQGVAGAAMHMTNPDRPAWQNMYATREGREKGVEWSKRAIWGNVPDKDKARFGSVENVTSRDFIAIWDKHVTGGAGGGFKGPVKADHYEEANKSLNFNTQERELYRTHLKNLYGSGGVDNADGSRSTLFVTTAEVDGKTYLIPTVKDGKILSAADAVAAAKKDGIENFPAYKSKEEADARYKDMHAFMEKDTGDYFEAKSGKTRMVEQPTYQQPRMQAGQQAAQSRPLVITNQQGNSVVVPTVSTDGFKVLSSSDAVAQYNKTGGHLGVFDNASAASEYADRLSSVERRAAVPREADIAQAAPMLGQTPKELQARQDHWETQFRAIDAQRKQIQEQVRKRAGDDLGQEEGAVKTHGAEGVSKLWTPQALGMALGPHDAAVALDKREANLKFHGATSGWNVTTDPAQMARDLATLDPVNTDPQSPAFAQYVKNFGEAGTLMTKMIEAREKATKIRGDTEMKKLIDASRSGAVTDEMVQDARPWLTHTELTAAYNLRDNPPVIRNDAATIEIEGNVKAMPPAEFSKYIMGWVAKNNVSKSDLKTYIERNEAYWSQGVQTPIVDAQKWLEDKLTPGMTGLEGTFMRGAMADARAELRDWADNPANRPLLKDRAAVMTQAREIYSRYRNEAYRNVRFGLAPSVYFPKGIAPDDVNANVIQNAERLLLQDMQKTNMFGQKVLSEAEIAGRWANIKQWKDALPIEADTQQPAPPSTKPQQPQGAPTVKPQKMGATIAPTPQPKPQTPGEQRQLANPAIERQPQQNGYDANAYQPDDVMRARTQPPPQENI